MTYISNNEETVKTEAGEFSLTQRNVGYADNDGRWTVYQHSELYWTNIGVLRRSREGRFLGVFDTYAEARSAIESAERMPEVDQPVTSMGRVSC